MLTKEGGTDYNEQRPGWGNEDWTCHLPFTKTGCQTSNRWTVFAFIFNGERDIGGSNLNLVHLSGLCKSKERAPADTQGHAFYTYRKKLYLQTCSWGETCKGDSANHMTGEMAKERKMAVKDGAVSLKQTGF